VVFVKGRRKYVRVGFAPALSTWMLCMLVLQEQISAHAGETFAKYPRFPRPLPWRIIKVKTFETITNTSVGY
jgi:hypothetical protein